ncbi:MAG: GrpB-like predicted nucleotidyltransferase (UPF0157 family) [Cognaticolwellia sp.]
MTPVVQVSPYDAQWAAHFKALKERIWPHVAEHALTIEHVGSTSVPGLAAKAIIDLDVVVLGAEKVQACIQAICAQGYTYEGERGIAGRHAFTGGEEPRHHLYVCLLGSLGLRNHLAVRDFLRLHPLRAKRYGDLKLELAEEHPYATAEYSAGKTDFLVALLKELGLSAADLAQVSDSNTE